MPEAFHGGALIRALRKLAGEGKKEVSQYDLADKLGLKQSNISQLEGRENITTSVLVRAVSALGLRLTMEEGEGEVVLRFKKGRGR